MNIVFMGTPDFAATILRHLADWTASFDAEANAPRLVAVYTQPDRPAGRGRRLQPSPVKALAETLGLPVEQPVTFKRRPAPATTPAEGTDAAAQSGSAAQSDAAQAHGPDADATARLAAYAPDVLAVAAYGLILPQAVLDIPTLGPFNVHGSLLPRYRGAAPIQRAVMNGDTSTGVTIMRMEAGLDSGPMLLQRAVVIGPDDTAGTMYTELADLGGRLLVEYLGRLLRGEAPTPVPQDASLATHAAKLGREDGILRWDETARAIHARLRGVTPRPGGRATFFLEDREVPVLVGAGRLPEPSDLADLDLSAPPGALLGLTPRGLAVRCADGAYLLTTLRPADRKDMSADAFWNGYLRGVAGVRVGG